LLACSSPSLVTYRGRNAAHIHLLFDVTYNIDQTLEPTVMPVICSIVTLYAKYLAKMLRVVRCRNKKLKKCSVTGPKRCCSGRNSTSTHSGSVLSLAVVNIVCCMQARSLLKLRLCLARNLMTTLSSKATIVCLKVDQGPKYSSGLTVN